MMNRQDRAESDRSSAQDVPSNKQTMLQSISGRHLLNTFLLFMAISCWCVAGRAAENVWSTEGPYGASVRTIAVHPTNPNVVLLGTIQHGIYKSTDAGENWRHIDSAILPDNQREIVFHPWGPDTVYAATVGGVFKSIDCGETWADISPPGRSGQEFRAIVLDPHHPSFIITGGVDDRWKSINSGLNWEEFSIDPDGGFDHEIDGLAYDPVNSNVIYLVTPDAEFGRGIYKSTDGGSNWFCIHGNADSSGAGNDVSVDWANPNIVYWARHDDMRVSGGRFLSKSTDGGASWFDVSLPNLNIWGVKVLCVSPANHQEVYAATVGDAIYRSIDGGGSWSPASGGLNTQVCASLAADAMTGALYLGLYTDGIYKSTNGGSNWRRISQSLRATTSNGLAFVPDMPSAIFAVGDLGCLFHSGEGEGWQPIAAGIPIENRPTAIELDKDTLSNIYISSFPRIVPLSAPCGLHVSTDGGRSWGLFHEGLPADQGFEDLALAYGPGEARRIFLGATFEPLPSSGIYYTDDLGLSWQRCQGGLPVQAYHLLTTAPSNPDLIAAADYRNRIYLSTDRGANWSQASALPRQYDEWVIDIQFDPVNYSLLYASSSYYGLFKSSDLGGTWANITNDIPVDIGAIIYGPTINPYNAQNMLVSSAHHGVYETRDGGAHWISFNAGLDTARCFGPIYFAPGDTTRLYLATLNASVWSIHRTLTGVEEEEPNLPAGISLSAYPNPFNSATTFTTNLEDDFTIDIFDITGGRIASLTARGGKAIWDASAYSSGVYFARAHNGIGERVIKIILLK
jgi:photosystem II stability/assembly factor-like uncharacterized protein